MTPDLSKLVGSNSRVCLLIEAARGGGGNSVLPRPRPASGQTSGKVAHYAPGRGRQRRDQPALLPGSRCGSLSKFDHRVGWQLASRLPGVAHPSSFVARAQSISKIVVLYVLQTTVHSTKLMHHSSSLKDGTPPRFCRLLLLRAMNRVLSICRENITVELRQDKIEGDPQWRATVVRCIAECLRG